MRYVVFRDIGASTCLLAGFPEVTATAPGRPDVDAAHGGTYFSYPSSADMRPGGHTTLVVETDAGCPHYAERPVYHRLVVGLPDGGTFTVHRPGTAFATSCGLRVSHLYVEPAVAEPPPDPEDRLTVSLAAPATAEPGTTLVYRAVLSNPTTQDIGLDRCPGYVEAATGPDTYLKDAHTLNCSAAGAVPAQGSTTFEMHLPIPADQGPGPLRLWWDLAGPLAPHGHAATTVMVS